MHLGEELTLPLWRLLWRAAVRSLTFAGATDRWSHLSATARAELRAGWPSWRRALKPLGLRIFWLGAIWSVMLGAPSTVLRFGWVLLLLPIAVIGVRDWFRDVPSRRASATPAHGTPGSRGSLPGFPTEHPTA